MLFVIWEMQYNRNGHSYGQLVIGSFIMTTCPLMHHVSCRVFLAKCLFTQVTQLPYRKIQWGNWCWFGEPYEVLHIHTLKGTEVSLTYVLCFFYLVSSSINVFIFHSTRLDTFWRDDIYTYIYGKGKYINSETCNTVIGSVYIIFYSGVQFKRWKHKK